MAGYLLALGLHLFCQVIYTVMLFVAKLSRGRTLLWLLLIWCVPIVGIGVAGAKFSRVKGDH